MTTSARTPASGTVGTGSTTAAGGHRRISRWFLVQVIAVVVTVVSLSTWSARMTWFADDFSFLDDSRSLGLHGAGAVFASYNQHWSTLSVLLYRGLLAVFGLHHYLPFAIPLIAAHTANVLLTRALLVRGGISTGLATVLPLTMVFLATAYTDLLWGFPVNLVGAVTLGLTAAVVASRVRLSWRRTAVVAVLLLASAATSNVGVAMTIAVAGYVLLTQGWGRAAVVAVVPGSGFLTWYGLWGRQEPAVCTARADPTAVPVFMAKALEKGFSGLTAVPGGSILVAVVVVMACYRIVSTRRIRANAWAVSSAVGCLTLYALSAIGRSACLEDASRAPRYAYFAVLVLPLVAVGLDHVWRRSRLGAGVVLVLVLASVTVNFVHLDRLADCRETRVHIAFAQLSFVPEPPSPLNPQATPAELQVLQRDHGLRLPPHPSDYPTAAGC